MAATRASGLIECCGSLVAQHGKSRNARKSADSRAFSRIAAKGTGCRFALLMARIVFQEASQQVEIATRNDMANFGNEV